MNIVLEGPDGAGKSTLGEVLASMLDMPLVQGKGPPKSEEEFHERCREYIRMEGVIFDRHPCISEPIYSGCLGRQNVLDHANLADFFATGPFIIYVRPTTRHLTNHVRKSYETQDHVDAVHANHRLICTAYEARMLEIAHYIYRRTDYHLASLLRAANHFASQRGQATRNIFPTSLDFATAESSGFSNGPRWGRTEQWANPSENHGATPSVLRPVSGSLDGHNPADGARSSD